MRVVVDANIAAAALIRPEGWTARQLERGDVTWLVPSYLFEELDEHEDKYAEKADVEREAFQRRVKRFRNLVHPVPAEEVLAVADHALVERAEAIDPDDAVYLAAVVAGDADLFWTRDGDLLNGFEGLAVQVVPRDPEGKEDARP